MTRGIRTAVAAATIFGSILATALGAQEIDTLAIRAHTMVLADDLLEGRGTGTRGERLAALYITSQLERLGLRPVAPDGGWTQPVPLREARIDNDATVLQVVRGDDVAVFASGRDFIVGTGGPRAFRDVSGRAVFAGTAGTAAQALRSRERLDGVVVVVLGSLGADALELIPDWTARGAEGIVYLVQDEQNFRLYVSSRGESRLYVDAEVDDPVWQPSLPVLIAGPRATAALLAGAPLAPDALDGRRPFEALDLERDVRATIRVDTREIAAANIAALLPGSDPALRDEVVVYTAHYDHLGIGAPDERGDSIYNGFSDNAAGVAMLLAIAEAMRYDPPARSVLFLFFTGEERGLLGSSYFAAHPLVPLDRIVALINLDAGAPPAPPRSWHVAGGDRSRLGETARRIAERHGWDARLTTANPNSDHWPFLRRGVPAIFLIPGQDWEGVTREEKEALHLRWDRYHSPADHWSPEFPFAGLKRYAEFALIIGRAEAQRR